MRQGKPIGMHNAILQEQQVNVDRSIGIACGGSTLFGASEALLYALRPFQKLFGRVYGLYKCSRIEEGMLTFKAFCFTLYEGGYSP